MTDEDQQRRIVIPGEVIFNQDDYLPGDGTEKRPEGIVALRFGLADEQNKLVKVIPLSGVYQPRRGNVVVGRVENITFNGWVMDIGSAESTFLSINEIPRFVNKDALEDVMEIGDMIVAKIFSINRRGVDLTVKGRGLGKIDDGIIVNINSNKVPRIIGKEGSMISLIKEETGCNITVGQNGLVWIKGDQIEKELQAKEAMMFISERPFVRGLTEEVKKWFDKNKK